MIQDIFITSSFVITRHTHKSNLYKIESLIVHVLLFSHCQSQNLGVMSMTKSLYVRIIYMEAKNMYMWVQGTCICIALKWKENLLVIMTNANGIISQWIDAFSQ